MEAGRWVRVKRDTISFSGRIFTKGSLLLIKEVDSDRNYRIHCMTDLYPDLPDNYGHCLQEMDLEEV